MSFQSLFFLVLVKKFQIVEHREGRDTELHTTLHVPPKVCIHKQHENTAASIKSIDS